MTKIGFDTKIPGRTNTTPENQKWTFANANEVKTSVNALYDGAGGSLITQNKLITSAQILAANSAPLSLLDTAPTATELVQVISAVIKLDYNSVEYATNLNIQIRWIGETQTIISVSNFLSGTVDRFAIINLGSTINTTTDFVGKGLEFFVQTGDPTAGDSPIQLSFLYKTTDFSLIV